MILIFFILWVFIFTITINDYAGQWVPPLTPLMKLQVILHSSKTSFVSLVDIHPYDYDSEK